jgi:hypothetical protein
MIVSSGRFSEKLPKYTRNASFALPYSRQTCKELRTHIGGIGSAMNIVTIGQWIIMGATDKEIVRQYVVRTLESMAEFDGVSLPYEFNEKLSTMIDSIPADEFEGCVDDVEEDI